MKASVISEITETLLNEIPIFSEEIKVLQRENLHLIQILDQSLAGYWDWDIPNNTEFLSPTFKSMFGYEDHEMENSPEAWQKIVHPNDLKSVFDVFNDHVSSKGEIPYENEVRYFHKNGSIVWVLCKGAVVEWSETGEPLRMIGCHIDITSYKEKSRAEKYSQALLTRNREIKEFAKIASHDLQEPVKNILGYSELLVDLLKDKLSSEELQYLRIIQEQANKASVQLNDLLLFAELGKEQSKTPIDISILTRKTIDSLINPDMDVRVELGYLPTINGVPKEIKVLFYQLISNAVKFKKPDQTLELKINYSEEPGFHCFLISDNGIGIAQDHKPHIFSIFNRLDTSAINSGSGIGLAKCKKIAENHGGSVEVDSMVGWGSIFKVRIRK